MPRKQAHESAEVDVAIVGGGAAGVGVGAALKRVGVRSLAILERHRVGASFRNWPAEMNFMGV
jgi:cation diffusion facilitator CzcD-associated flavoprotein CzcO